MTASCAVLSAFRESTMSQSVRIGTSRRAWPRRPIGFVIAFGLLFALGLIALALVGGFIVDLLWFGEVGYAPVFWTVVVAKSAVFAVTLVASAIILLVNGRIALRL